MSDNKKKSKRRKDEYTGPGGNEEKVEKPSKDEFKIAKWIKNNVPTKKTKFLNHNVEYFTASKALDGLMASKFGQGDNCMFPTRELAIEFLDTMLIHKFFHRAKKVPVSESELRRKKPSGGCCGDATCDETHDQQQHQETKKKKSTKGSTTNVVAGENKQQQQGGTDAESSKEGKTITTTTTTTENKEKGKLKRKIRLDMHPDQVFVDGSEAYVWIYDPIPMYYWLFGALLVIGAIVICLFPLWPPSLRKGVYYLSIAAAGFLVFILSLAVIRFIVFCIVWVLTGSKHHFWLLPNLTEDVGFFASFWPLYQHTLNDGSATTKDKDKKKRRRKGDKDSDAEDETIATTINESEADQIENIKENETGTINDSGVITSSTTVRRRNVTKPDAVNEDKVNPENDDGGGDDDQNDDAPDNASGIEDIPKKSKSSSSRTPSESESESSQRSSTGRDFEIVDADEVETS